MARFLIALGAKKSFSLVFHFAYLAAFCAHYPKLSFGLLSPGSSKAQELAPQTLYFGP
jgi:hypothetical protein